MKKKKFNVGITVIYIVLILWALTTIFPFVWVILNSFKPSAEVLTSSFSLPKEFTLMNYENAFGNMNVLNAYKNSLLISGRDTEGEKLNTTIKAKAMTTKE